MCRLRLPRRAPRNVAHESTVTRPQSAASANAISNFPEADFSVLIGVDRMIAPEGLSPCRAVDIRAACRTASSLTLPVSFASFRE